MFSAYNLYEQMLSFYYFYSLVDKNKLNTKKNTCKTMLVRAFVLKIVVVLYFDCFLTENPFRMFICEERIHNFRNFRIYDIY